MTQFYNNFSSIQKQSANWHTGSFSFENFLHSKEIHQLLITFYEIYNPWSLQGPPYRRENYLHVEYGFPFFLSERVHIVKHHFIFLRLNKEYFVQIYGLCKGDISPFFA